MKGFHLILVVGLTKQIWEEIRSFLRGYEVRERGEREQKQMNKLFLG